MGEPTAINVKRGEFSLETERWRAVPWDQHPSGEWTWQVEDGWFPGRWHDRHRADRQHRTLIASIAALEADLAAATARAERAERELEEEVAEKEYWEEAYCEIHEQLCDEDISSEHDAITCVSERVAELEATEQAILDAALDTGHSRPEEPR